MAGDWMKFEKTTLDKPEVFEMAGILGIDPDAVVGKLLRVWDWFDDQSVDGYAPVTLAAQLNRNTGCAGFTEAMQKVGWLEVENDRLKIPNFSRHNGQTAKDRALSSKRMAKHRGKSYGDGVTSAVTKTQPEKRREEKSVIPLNPQGGKERDSKNLPTSPEAIRISQLYGRRLTTKWSDKEIRAFKAICPINADDLEIVCAYTEAEKAKGENGRQRRDLLTFLNNFTGEVDRAKAAPSLAPKRPQIKFLDD